MEALFQILATDALRSFKDSSEINTSFALLSQGVRYEAYLWNKFYSHLQSRAPVKRRASSLYSSTGASNIVSDSACNSASDSRTVSRSNSPSDASASDSGCEGHSTLRRFSVKDRRRMFEQPQSEEATGKGKLAPSVCREPPRSALKRVASLKDRRKFWESLAAKASKDQSDQQPSAATSTVNNFNVIKSSRKSRTPDLPARVTQRTSSVTQVPPPAAAEAPPAPTPTVPAHIPTDTANTQTADDRRDNDDLNCLSTLSRDQRSRSHENVPSPVPETQGNLDSCQLTSSKQDLIFTTSAAQSTDLTCDTGSWVEVQTEPTYSRVSGFIDDEIGEYGSFMGGSPSAGRDANRPPGSPVFQPSNQLGKLFGVEPSKVTVHGQGLKEGFVNKDITFRVYTGDAGPGFLTVGIQERSPGTLKKVHLHQIDSEGNKKGLWEATYQVSQPGYYVIFVRWSDCNIAGSPFVAQITNPSAIF